MAYLELPGNDPTSDMGNYVALLLGAVDDWLVQEFNWSADDYPTATVQLETLKTWLAGIIAMANERLAGETIFWVSPIIPDGWLECDGSLLAVADYDDLFGAIGYTWGDDGVDFFALPDLRGKSPMGAGTPAGGSVEMLLGNSYGEQQHTLTTPEIPSHNHPPPTGADSYNTVVTSGGNRTEATGSNRASGNTTGNTGGGEAHNNLHPVAVGTFIIFTGII